MGSFNYNRTYTLYIEDPLKIDKPSNQTKDKPLDESATQIIIGKDDLSSIDVEAIKITDLHMEAKTSFSEKSKGSDSPSCTIKIYNLSEETRNRVVRVNSPCLLYTSPSPRDGLLSRMPSSA